jgi:hypothetical protein
MGPAKRAVAARRGSAGHTPRRPGGSFVSIDAPTDIGRALTTACRSRGPCVGQTGRPPVMFGGLAGGSSQETEGRRNPGAGGSANRFFLSPHPQRSGHAAHPAGLMIADAVRYMSVHSWNQPDSHGHSGTSPGQNQQPARPGKPSPRAVFAGGGRCCVWFQDIEDRCLKTSRTLTARLRRW